MKRDATPVSPADALLALCIRPEAADQEALRSLVLSDLPWTEIFSEALWHKVAFLAYDRLASSDLLDAALTEGNLPLLLLNHWKQLHRVNLHRNRLYLEECQTISACLRWHEADHAVAKGGPLLIGRVYDACQRKMYDVDFIARREHLSRIQAAFAELGYQNGVYHHATETITPLPHDEIRKWLLHSRGMPNFLRKVQGDDLVDVLVAQVQFKVGSTADGSATDAGPLLERAVTRNAMRVVDDADLLLQLVLHIVRESRDVEFAEWRMDWNLIKLCDLDRFLHTTADTAAFVDRAEQLGFLEQSVYALLTLAQVFPSPVTDRLVAEVLDRRSDLEQVATQVRRIDVHGRISAMTTHPATTSPWTRLVGSKTS
jgi:Uncharacterised nucleotidyltransferase